MSEYKKSPRQKYIRCLERRAAYLEEKVKGSHNDLSFSKAECNALKWAVATLKELYPNTFKSEDSTEELKEASG